MNWLLNLLGSMLSAFSSLTGSYALALLLYALIFKIVFIPFGIKQQKNQIAMAKLRPKIALIEKKYAGRHDQVTLRKKQEEIMELQQKEGYSVFSGCLPLLLQLPIIILLYNVIRSPLSFICKFADKAVIAAHKIVNGIEEATEVAIGSIDQIKLIGQINAFGDKSVFQTIENFDISKIPDFTLFGFDLAATPSFSPFTWLIIIPFLAAGASWLSMVLTRKWGGAAQAMGEDSQSQMSMKMMDIMMPLLTLWMAFSFSGMLGLYWVYQSLLGILQTFILMKAMPLPKFTDEELKAMQKAEKARQKAERSAAKTQPKYKSLHYIDDDDYDTLPEISRSAQKPADLSGTDAPSLKDDSDRKK